VSYPDDPRAVPSDPEMTAGIGTSFVLGRIYEQKALIVAGGALVLLSLAGAAVGWWLADHVMDEVL
jgi:hypothetical protein